jgi:hypothetical protein
MNETTKKALIAVVAVLAVAIAGFEGYKMFGGERTEVTKSIQMPPTFKSEKQSALDAQKGGQAATTGGERDLGGPLGGN